MVGQTYNEVIQSDMLNCKAADNKPKTGQSEKVKFTGHSQSQMFYERGDSDDKSNMICS